MTAVTEAVEEVTETASDLQARWDALPGWARFGGTAAIAVVLMAIVRVVADADDLTSSGTAAATLRLSIPILFAAIGGMFSERAGVVNIGLEGMMILGAWTAAFFGFEYGVWVGLLAGFLGGLLGGLLHAVATVQFGVDHIVSGVAINFIAPGLARFLSGEYFPQRGGSISNSPQVTGSLGEFTVPILSGGFDGPDVLGNIEDRRWFLISDVAGILRGFTSDLSTFTILALLLVPASTYLFFRTRTGLRLRSVGENPTAADSLGVPVYRMKYLGVALSGGFAGLGGAFLVIEGANIYRESMTGNRGFIALAALVVGNWLPVGVLMASLLFGFGFALQLRNAEAVHALLLYVSFATVLLAFRALVQRKLTVLFTLGVIALGAGLWFLTTEELPSEVIFAAPYALTLVVATAASSRLRPPAADGLPWRKGQ